MQISPRICAESLGLSYLNGLSRFRQDRGGTVKCLRWADHPSAVKEDRERCHGETWGETLTEKPVWHVVREYAMKAGIDKLAPHDLRRTCVQLCYAAGGELEQIQFLLGHLVRFIVQPTAVCECFGDARDCLRR
ncbi:MAG: hypothetical protein DMG93_22555 [Acidobacteria bacterium]|nr:MAG: hypothetical protein DMG93_22555 [Acidobacteriota bacterium]